MRIIFLTFLLGIFLACSGTEQVGSTNESSDIYSGQFVDRPVEGLKYSSGTNSGFTDSEGGFVCEPGETIDFLIGNLKLGTSICKKAVFPTDLTLEGFPDENGGAVAIGFILHQLNSISDNQNEEILKIPANLRDMQFSTDIDFENFDASVDLEKLINIFTEMNSQFNSNFAS